MFSPQVVAVPCGATSKCSIPITSPSTHRPLHSSWGWRGVATEAQNNCAVFLPCESKMDVPALAIQR